VLDAELAQIVNISMALEMPLLLKGEPGTGKTMLAHAIAESLEMPLIVLNVKSSMKLVEALYQYDTLTRLNDSRFGDSQRDVSNIEAYIKMGKIGQAFRPAAHRAAHRRDRQGRHRLPGRHAGRTRPDGL
jgi:MoxR-like ATPase